MRKKMMQEKNEKHIGEVMEKDTMILANCYTELVCS